MSYKRKQRVRFRTRYAESMAREWSRMILNGGIALGIVIGVIWSSTFFLRFWDNSTVLRVNEVVFSGDTPSKLRAMIPIKSEDHLLKIRPGTLEREFLKKFPELERLTVRRGLTRNVTVSGKFRTPVAKIKSSGEEMALDRSGTMFKLSDVPAPSIPLPLVDTATIDDRRILMDYLSTWQKKMPSFYSLIKKVETDRMREFTVELSDGVLIDWGPVDEADILVRAEKVLRLKGLFTNTKNPAWLTFVTSDRLVMDRNWQKIEPTK